MKIYHYHELSGEFIGHGVADPDPLLSGNWLIPANATTQKPPITGDGKFAAWNGEEWELRNIPNQKEETKTIAMTDSKKNQAWNGKTWVELDIPPPPKE